MSINSVTPSITQASFTDRYPNSQPLQKGANTYEDRQSEDSIQNSLSKKVVEWIRADKPAYQQVFMYTTIAIATITLALSCVGIPLLLNIAKEHEKQENADQLRLLDQPIITLLGGQDAYDRLPLYTFDTRDAREEGSCPATSEVHASIMRGTDKYSRPVLFLKIYDKLTSSSFVEMIYRQYTREGKNNPWMRNHNSPTIFEDLVLGRKSLYQLDQLLQGRHPRFTLSR